MSCRETPGGSAVISIARLYSGCTDRTAQRSFHSLKAEAQGLPGPTRDDVVSWTTRVDERLDNLTDDPRRLASIRERLYEAESGPLPDGPTWHAMVRAAARARQQQIIKQVKASPLDDPGSHADRYELARDGRPAYVWYSSFGSNLSSERLASYIQGGRPPGGRVSYRGCRDHTPPLADVPVSYQGTLHFALHSGNWGGSVAFLDPDTRARSLGRAYLLTTSQFDDVVAQENGLTVGKCRADLNRAIETGDDDSLGTRYGRMVHVGDLDGAPVITFTSSFTVNQSVYDADLERRAATARGWEREAVQADLAIARKRGLVSTKKPSASYLRMLSDGLQDTYGMSHDQVADYLMGSPGMEPWSRPALLDALTAPPPPPPKSYFSTTPSSSSAGKGKGKRGKKGKAKAGSVKGPTSPRAPKPPRTNSPDVGQLPMRRTVLPDARPDRPKGPQTVGGARQMELADLPAAWRPAPSGPAKKLSPPGKNDGQLPF